MNYGLVVESVSELKERRERLTREMTRIVESARSADRSLYRYSYQVH
jgi:hypothetical protein